MPEATWVLQEWPVRAVGNSHHHGIWEALCDALGASLPRVVVVVISVDRQHGRRAASQELGVVAREGLGEGPPRRVPNRPRVIEDGGVVCRVREGVRVGQVFEPRVRLAGF